MIVREVTVLNKLGLHARAAAQLVRCASSFESDIALRKDGKSVDAKGIMSLMMLAATQGARLELEVDGADENEACEKIVDLFNSRFGESE